MDCFKLKKSYEMLNKNYGLTNSKANALYTASGIYHVWSEI